MFKSKYDLLFGFCITFIIILAVYFGFQRSQRNNLEKYLQLVQDKISGMISDKDKEEFNQFFSDLEEGLKDNSVPASEVERLAENLLEIRKRKKNLSKEDLKKLMPVFKTDSTTQNLLAEFDYINSKDWKKLAGDLEISFARCDSIRMRRNQIKKMYERIKDQIDIHAQISKELKRNSIKAMEKFDEIRHKDINSEIKNQLLQELDRLKLENEKIKNKLSHMDELKNILEKEKKILQNHKHLVDSLKSNLL
jgi:hypothetical protein